MDINLIFRIAAVGILVSILSQVLKHSGREEQAFLASLAGLILVLSWVLPYIYDLFQTIRQLFAPNTPFERMEVFMEGLFFAIGFLLGGVVGVLIMCLLQINRIGRKEDSEE